jgi:hypothetical protein
MAHAPSSLVTRQGASVPELDRHCQSSKATALRHTTPSCRLGTKHDTPSHFLILSTDMFFIVFKKSNVTQNINPQLCPVLGLVFLSILSRHIDVQSLIFFYSFKISILKNTTNGGPNHLSKAAAAHE